MVEPFIVCPHHEMNFKMNLDVMIRRDIIHIPSLISFFHSITYDSYLDIAVIPYTVQHFTSLLEEIVEAQFPICDEGEPILPR